MPVPGRGSSQYQGQSQKQDWPVGGTAGTSVWLEGRIPSGTPPVTEQVLRRCVFSRKPSGEFLLRCVSSVASLSSRTLLSSSAYGFFWTHSWVPEQPSYSYPHCYSNSQPPLHTVDSQTAMGRTVERGCDLAPGVAAGHMLLALEPLLCPFPSAGSPQRFLCSSKKVIFHGGHSKTPVHSQARGDTV